MTLPRIIYPAEELLKMCEAYRQEPSPSGERWLLTLARNGYLLHPYPIPHFLYRGQHTHHSPCLPSTLRGIPPKCHQMPMLSIKRQALLIINTAKSIWFRISIEKHPSIVWAQKNNVQVDFVALSQHYELATGYIDLTHNIEVAAFFATCMKSNDKWVPAKSGKGVLYRLERQEIPEHLHELTGPVGLQPLPRPDEQGAWVTEIPMGCDFEAHPAVTWLEFEHNETVSEYFLKKFDGGLALFPPEPLARVADAIKTSPHIPSRCIEAAFDGYAREPGGLPEIETLRNYLSHFASVDEPSSLLTDMEIESARVLWESRVDMFGHGTKIIPFRVEEVKAPHDESGNPKNVSF